MDPTQFETVNQWLDYCEEMNTDPVGTSLPQNVVQHELDRYKSDNQLSDGKTISAQIGQNDSGILFQIGFGGSKQKDRTLYGVIGNTGTTFWSLVFDNQTAALEYLTNQRQHATSSPIQRLT